MTEKKRTGPPPGNYYGGGRKKSERPLARYNRVLYEDQAGITSEEIRQAIDEWIKRKHPLNFADQLGDKQFNSAV